MAKDKYRVIAEDVTVAGHRKGEEFSFDEDGEYNVEALVAAKIIQPVKASDKKEA